MIVICLYGICSLDHARLLLHCHFVLVRGLISILLLLNLHWAVLRVRSCDEVSESVSSEKWLRELYNELQKQGITLPER